MICAADGMPIGWEVAAANIGERVVAAELLDRVPVAGHTVIADKNEDVPLAVELRDGDPVSELSQAGVAATSGAAVGRVVVGMSVARLVATSRSTATASLARSV